jgi:O-acetyl-ADP-ribose deacetylase (regulator of RNase III)
MKKKVVAAIATAAVALSLSGSGIASADDRKGGEKITSLLSSLVSKGTITQSQADAIAQAAKDARAVGKVKMDKDRAAIDAVVTSTLGISLETVKSRLKAGETLAAIAGDKKAALITAISAEINKQIDAAAAAGKLTAAQVTTEKAKTTERVTNMVERVKGFGHKGNMGGSRA